MKNSINIVNWVKVLSVVACISCMCSSGWAQTKEVNMSTGAEPPKKEEVIPETQREKLTRFGAEKKYDSAILIYTDLYKATPDDFYHEYLNTLLIAKKYKEAEKLVQARIGSPNLTSIYEIDLGKIYKLQGKDGKAREWFDTVLKKVNGDDNLTQRLAKAFTDADQGMYAIRVYEKASQLIGNPFFYSIPMAAIYAKAGDLDKAMDAMLAPPAGQYISLDQVKGTFLEWMGNDPKRLQIGQKNLLKHIDAQPENTVFAELLTWLYTQKNDWEGALMQIEAVDERNKEDGRRLMAFARTAAAAKQYEIALKTYDEVIAKGAESPNSVLARSEKINTQFEQLQNTAVPKAEDIKRLMGDYNSMLTEYPLYYATQMAANYAMVASFYADSIDRAIEILQKAIKYPDTKRGVAGKLKLQLGDCYVMKGKIWDASLIYSQVDKEFKQDVLGENARFSNAKLAYYRGDFDWAQHMLTALKASTTELIANDALYLSVLITENVEDSNTYPLIRFAHADMLRSQNKDSLANNLLDSIATAFPKHPLNDDILMAHAQVAQKRKQFDKAITYLTAIVEKYGQDVLGDDALFMIAEIYRTDLLKNDLAKKYYEQLIIDFPGSTFVQIARQKLREINEGNTQ